jgi:hypothetical protein
MTSALTTLLARHEARAASTRSADSPCLTRSVSRNADRTCRPDEVRRVFDELNVSRAESRKKLPRAN